VAAAMSDQTIATLVMWLLMALLVGAVCLTTWKTWAVLKAQRDAEREARRAAGSGARPVRRKVIIGTVAALLWLGVWALVAWGAYHAGLQTHRPKSAREVGVVCGVLCVLIAPWFVWRFIKADEAAQADRETTEQRRQFERW